MLSSRCCRGHWTCRSRLAEEQNAVRAVVLQRLSVLQRATNVRTRIETYAAQQILGWDPIANHGLPKGEECWPSRGTRAFGTIYRSHKLLFLRIYHYAGLEKWRSCPHYLPTYRVAQLRAAFRWISRMPGACTSSYHPGAGPSNRWPIVDQPASLHIDQAAERDRTETLHK